MVIGGTAFATCALASETMLSTATVDAEFLRPIRLLLNEVDYTDFTGVESLSIDDSIGEQTTCSFTLINAGATPEIGNRIRITYYSEVLFDGTIATIKHQTNNLNNFVEYQCQAV